jgi:hypothetical protein
LRVNFVEAFIYLLNLVRLLSNHSALSLHGREPLSATQTTVTTLLHNLNISVVTILLQGPFGMVRKEVLGKSERKVLEAYLRGERLKTYNVILARIRHMGLRAIIEGCESDIVLLKKLEHKELAKTD